MAQEDTKKVQKGSNRIKKCYESSSRFVKVQFTMVQKGSKKFRKVHEGFRRVKMAQEDTR